MKTRSSKSRKIDIFSKGLTDGFAPKMAIFPNSFFRKFRLGKCISLYSRTENDVSRLLKQEVQKIEK